MSTPSSADSWLATWSRRALSIPLLVLCFLLISLLFPVALIVAAFVDLLQRHSWTWCRCVCFLALFLWCEVLGVTAAAFLWLVSGVWAGTSRHRFLDWNFRLQCWWGRTLALGGAILFDVDFAVEGDEPNPERPILVFIRHASSADTILALLLFSVPYGIRLRYVLKRPLLLDPCLDIVGNRLPNAFVHRSGQSREDIAAIGRLMEGLSGGEGVLIYPEGTRFSPAKLEAARRRLESSDSDPELLRSASALRFVLPPRLGGPLELLRRNDDNALDGRGADVMFVAHAGFESVTSLADLRHVVGRTVRIRIWRVAYEDLPRSTEQRARWLFEHWRRIDETVDRHQPPADLNRVAASLRIT